MTFMCMLFDLMYVEVWPSVDGEKKTSILSLSCHWQRIPSVLNRKVFLERCLRLCIIVASTLFMDKKEEKNKIKIWVKDQLKLNQVMHSMMLVVGISILLKFLRIKRCTYRRTEATQIHSNSETQTALSLKRCDATCDHNNQAQRDWTLFVYEKQNKINAHITSMCAATNETSQCFFCFTSFNSIGFYAILHIFFFLFVSHGLQLLLLLPYYLIRLKISLTNCRYCKHESSIRIF